MTNKKDELENMDVEQDGSESENKETLLHAPMQVADLHRPVLPKLGEDRQNFFLNRITFVRMSGITFILFFICFFFLVITHFQLKKAYPYKNTEIHRLETELRTIYVELEDTKEKAKRGELEIEKVAIAEEIRTLDQILRIEYFSLIDKRFWGSWLLFITGIITLLAFRLSRVYSPIVPVPIVASGKEERMDREQKMLLRAIGAIVLIVVVPLIWLGLQYHKESPGSILKNLLAESNDGTVVVKKTVYATLKEYQANWPFFRGTEGSGIYKGNIPFEWNAKTGKNIAWKSNIPLNGLSSPVVWGKNIFLTGAAKSRRELYCYDSSNGKKLWTIRVGEKTEKRNPEVFSPSMYASPTAVTDGQRVYALFANGDLICANNKGDTLWTKDLGLPDDGYGHSSSLLLYKKTLLVQWDHNGSSAALFAFDLRTGKRVWRSDRGHNEATWSSPILSAKEYKIRIKGGFYKGRVLLLASPPGLQAYDPGTGNFLWKIKPELHGDFGPSPILVNDKILFCANGENSLLCINMDGSLAWENSDIGTSGIPSPTSDGKYVWLVNEMAELNCLNFSDGKIVYSKQLDGFDEINASPAIINNKILIMGSKGKCLYISMKPKFEILSEPVLNKGAWASPSFGKNVMYLRDGKKLISIK